MSLNDPSSPGLHLPEMNDPLQVARAGTPAHSETGTAEPCNVSAKPYACRARRSMRNLRCVIGRHDWRMKYDNEGRPLRSADDRGVITFEVTTPWTGHTPEPIQNRRPLNQTFGRVRTGRCRRLGVSCRVGLKPRARFRVRLARLATWPSHDHIFLYLVLRDRTRRHPSTLDIADDERRALREDELPGRQHLPQGADTRAR
jgi:hypothetical protein